MFSYMFLGLFVCFLGPELEKQEHEIEKQTKKKTTKIRVQHLDENLEQLLLAFQDIIKGRIT